MPTDTNLLCSDRTLIVFPWPEPDTGEGHDVRGRYTELFVLPLLGPTATWLLRRLVDGLDAFPDGYELDLGETAAALGLQHQPGRPGPFAKALERVLMFGYAQQVPYGITVRARVQPISARQLGRLPSHLQRLHADWGAPRQSGAKPVTSSIRLRVP